MTFHLPPSSTPRPGEKVVVYTSSTKFSGTFFGYNTVDELIVTHGQTGILNVDDYRKIRLENPQKRVEGCWSELPEDSVVVDANPNEVDQLTQLLTERIFPGPMYIDFVYEIWARGYEVFLVGGTVRDVLSGDGPNDVDLVTSMPFFLLEPLAEAMFGHDGFSRHREDGTMQVGAGAGLEQGTDTPLIDVKNFFQFAPGTPNAQFGSDLMIDQSLRDFACNAVYYDPINKKFLDPCGFGINDARERRLSIVNDNDMEHPTHKKAMIALRFFKFVLRGFEPTASCVESLQVNYKPLFLALGPTQALAQINEMLLDEFQGDDERHQAALSIKKSMQEFGFEDVWAKFYVALEHGPDE